MRPRANGSFRSRGALSTGPYSSDRALGNFHSGVVVPGGPRTVSPQRATPGKELPPFQLALQGAGPVQSLEHDPSTGLMTAYQGEAPSGLVFGTLQSDLGVLGDGGIANWATLLLPNTFKDGSTLPTLPAGFAWMRLSEGSWRWGYADYSMNTGLESWLPTDSPQGAPTLRYAFVDAESTDKDPGTTRPSGIPGPRDDLVYLVFTSEVKGWRSDYPSYIRVTSNNSDETIGVTEAYLVSGHPRVVALGLSRKIRVAQNEAVTISVGEGTFYNDSKYPGEGCFFLPVSTRCLRSEYIIVVNPGSEELSTGTRVVITQAYTVSDKITGDNNRHWYNDQLVGVVAVLGSGGSSGGSKFLVASVLGGNADVRPGKKAGTPGEGGRDSAGYLQDDYTDLRGFSFPLPIYLDRPSPSLPTVTDWTAYDLPADYSFASKLPRLPDGLCWLRLERPHVLGASAWYANLPAGIEYLEEGLYPRAVYASFRTAKDPTEILVSFDRNISVDPKNKRGFGVSTDGTVALKVSSYSASGKTVTVRLSRVIKPSESLTISVFPSAVLVNVKPPIKNTAATLPVHRIGDVGTLVLGINRSGLQGYTKGDLVLFSATAVTITDGKGLSRVAYDILCPAARGVRAHTHSADPQLNTYGASYVLG